MKQLESALTNERTWTSAGERFMENRRLAALVGITYKASKEIQPIVAMNCDPTPESRSPKWSPVVAEYIADVELAVRRTLEFKPEAERNELREAWGQFLEDDTRLDMTQRRMINILGPAFHRRELHPGIYFKPRRLTRRAA